MKVAETYVQMKERHQKEVNEFPMMWAFNNDQFAQGMKKLGLQETDTDKIYRIAPGGFIRKTDADKLDEMFTRHTKERKEAMAADIDGTATCSRCSATSWQTTSTATRGMPRRRWMLWALPTVT